ncbi:MAG: TolC family protein [Gammaproteobacteria bacterium]|nr:TolC family protein [Gammaproteobacteria bacterium]
MQKIFIALLLSTGVLMSFNINAQTTQKWSLINSIQRAIEVVPELGTADAQIGKQQAELEQANAWPNPTIDIQVDDKLGLDDNSGGYDVTEFAISQPLPIGRLKDQRNMAQAQLAGAKAQYRQQKLWLEYEVAKRFHTVQLAQARYQQTKMRWQQARRYQSKTNTQTGNDPLIRYLTPLERMRLNILQQEAKQMLNIAEGEYNEAASSFKALLDIPAETKLVLTDITPVPTPAEFSSVENSLMSHPLLDSKQQDLAAARAGVDVAKSQRFEDPTLTLFRQRESMANGREDVTGVIMSVQIPLWDSKKSHISKARHNVRQVQSELSIQQRELQTSAQKSHMHLGHLIEQAEHYRSKLLKPAQQVFNLTRKGFNAGELNILTLIDANNTYFDAKVRHLELLQEGWLELAELRHSVGLSLLTGNSLTNNMDVEINP